MQDNWQGARVIRDNGVRGKVTAVTADAMGTTVIIAQFDDGEQLAVSPEVLVEQTDGVYRLLQTSAQLESTGEVMIPLLAEELVIGKQQVERSVVRVHKRVETHEATLDAEVTSEDVTVERLPINALVEGAAPQVREENGVIIIPVLEEVLVVEKRLLLREEVRLTKHTTTASTPQNVTLRREIVEIERAALDGMNQAGSIRTAEAASPATNQMQANQTNV